MSVHISYEELQNYFKADLIPANQDSDSDDVRLTVSINQGEFLINGRGNWGPASPIPPGPIAVLLNARDALIAQDMSQIRNQAENPYLGVHAINQTLQKMLSGMGDSIDTNRKNYGCTGWFVRSDVHYHIRQITSWKKTGGWNDDTVYVTSRFEFNKLHNPVTTVYTVQQELSQWKAFVAGRRLRELGQHIYENLVLPNL